MASRGRLKVLIGAAPGVGKTYAMLEEGHRLVADGSDVVVGFLETHGRAGTTAMAQGLEVVPRAAHAHRGITLEEMDLGAILERAPEVALVDELAHTNAERSEGEAGYGHRKRFEDVLTLLDAGIDVISTLNIQHIESLNDVVEQITGVPQRETIPDSILRGADQLELIDLSPQVLRDRLGKGHVYPAERIDAALSNYFREGNLTALRELALIWLADEVDQALNGYRESHGIDTRWEARERVVVALAGIPGDEALLRRGARIAARSAGGDLLAVHVLSHDGLRTSSPAALALQRQLVEQLNGSYHQVVGEDCATALVEFARSVNATQLVLGASRRSWLSTALTGPGIGASVVRASGDIDVHMVNLRQNSSPRRLPPLTGALTRERRLIGFAVALVGAALLTFVLSLYRSEESITIDVLSFQLLTVIVALIGGLWPAIFAAVLSAIIVDYMFIAPLYTVQIHQPLHMFALVLNVVIAVLVSIIVDNAARRARLARRAAAESEFMQSIAGSVVRGQSALRALVERTREAFQLDGVRLMRGDQVLEEQGTPGPVSTRVAVGEECILELSGRDLQASEQRLLSVVTAQAETALEHEDLEQTAKAIAPLAASDKVRGALLSALSHDLRRPLAAASAAVGGLKLTEGELAESDARELLDTADESLRSLSTLVTDLLDVSRLNAGGIRIATTETDPSAALAAALDELEYGPEEVTLALGHGDALALCDHVLLQRVLVNLLVNAHRYTPEGVPVHVSTSVFGTHLEIRVIDHGPGVPEEQRSDMFVPFQRLGDTDNSTGLGLGLALSRGFVEGMHGTLTPEETPGGGLTMVISLPRAGAGTEGSSDEDSYRR